MSQLSSNFAASSGEPQLESEIMQESLHWTVSGAVKEFQRGELVSDDKGRTTHTIIKERSLGAVGLEIVGCCNRGTSSTCISFPRTDLPPEMLSKKPEIPCGAKPAIAAGTSCRHATETGEKLVITW